MKGGGEDYPPPGGGWDEIYKCDTIIRFGMWNRAYISSFNPIDQ